jgi:type II secretion system protein G
MRKYYYVAACFCFFVGVVPSHAYLPAYNACVADIKQIEGGLNIFYLAHHRYPTQEEGLLALVERPPTVSSNDWFRYLNLDDTKDPWGNSYVYRVPGRRDTNSCDVYSLGEDGRSVTDGNDADDINNWDETHKWTKYYCRSQPPLKLFTWGAYVLGMIVLLFLVKAKRDCARASAGAQQA